MKRNVFIALVVLVAACGTSRNATVARVAAGLDAARAAFTLADEQMQNTLVDEAPDRPTAVARVAEHRKKRDLATKAFQAAYAGLAVAALEPSDLNLARAIELGGAALAAFNAMKGVTP